MATPKQVTFIESLTLKAGYGRYLSSRLAADLPHRLSFGSRESSKYQTIQRWAESLTTAQASAVIDWFLSQAKTDKAS
jgi:hypothetical protein